MAEIKGFEKLAEVLKTLIIAMSDAIPYLQAMYNHYREIAENQKQKAEPAICNYFSNVICQRDFDCHKCPSYKEKEAEGKKKKQLDKSETFAMLGGSM